MKTEWIRVEDRLPDKGDNVLIFEPHCLNNADKGIGTCIVDDDFAEKKSNGDYWVTHWMPLPIQPKVQRSRDDNT